MNLLDAEDMIKGLPDQALMQQAQMPTGEIPQFLVISEIKNRADMRKRYEAQLKEQPQGTVAEQVMREGIAGMLPQQGVTPQMGQQPPQGGPQMPQQGMPPQGMPPQGMLPQMPPQGGPQGMPPQMPPQGMPPQGMPPGMPPMGMAAGGIVRMQGGGVAKIQKLMNILAVGGVTAPDLIAQGYTVAEIDAAQNQLRERMSMPVAGMGNVSAMREISDPVRTPQMGAGDQYDPPFIRGITDQIPSLSGTSPEQARVADAYGGSGMPSLSERAADAVDVLGDGDMARARTEIASNTLLPPDTGVFSDIDSAVSSAIQDMYGMIPKSSPDGGIVGRGLDRAGGLGSELASQLSPEGPLARGIRDVMGSEEASQRISDVYDESGAGAGIGQFFREIPGAAGRTFGAASYKVANLPLIAGGANMLDQMLTGSIDDPLTLGDIFGGKDKEPSQAADLFGTGFGAPTKPGTDPAAPIDTLLKEAQQANTDSSGKGLEKTGPPLQGTNNRAVQGTGSSATLSLIDEIMADLRGRETQASPTLDLSDILARSDRMTKANILMQLGSGIAGGDVAKGIEKAGMAGVQGAQEAAKIEMAQRISQTKAGQEDIRRGEQRDLDIAKLGIQREQVATMDQRLKNELSKAERVSKGQLFNLVSDLVQEATDDTVTDDKLGTVDKLSAYFMQKYAPLLGIDLSEEDLALLGRTYGGAGSPDPLGIRGAP